MREVADGVFAVTGTAVSWLLVRDGSDVTLVDGGYPADAGRVVDSLRRIGRRPADVQAVLVTHAHVDHLGGALALHEQHGTPLLVHPAELANAHGTAREQATTLDVVRRAWRPRVARWAIHVARAGGTQDVRATGATAFEPGAALDLPGSPVPVHTGGHTSGHTAYHFPARGVLATGDALVTAHPLSSREGPQLLPDFFAHDPTGVDAALDVLADVDADVVVPGHGPAWRGSPADAVALALESGRHRRR